MLLSKLDKRFPVERLEATVSQSTVPSPPLRCTLPVDGLRRPRAGPRDAAAGVPGHNTNANANAYADTTTATTTNDNHNSNNDNRSTGQRARSPPRRGVQAGRCCGPGSTYGDLTIISPNMISNKINILSKQ